jgi:hypothetical protein
MKRILLSLLFLVFVTFTFAQERVYVPTLKFPDNNAVSQMPNVIVSWNAITGSLNLQYKFQMDTTTLFNSPLLVDTTQTLLTGYKTRELYFGKKYFWRVKAIDNGQTSAWSVVWNFTVFNTVELSTPAVNAIDQDPNVTVTWLGTLGPSKKPITGTTFYDYQVDLDSNFNSSALMQGTTAVTVLKALTHNLRFGTKYYFRVRTGHAKAKTAYSPYRAFTVIDKFALQSPANNANKSFLNVSLKWKNVNGLLAYSFEIATDQAFTQLVAESEVDTNFMAAFDLKFGVKYYWRVRGRHQTDTSQWSNPYAFTTINTVDLKYPAKDQQMIAIKPLMQWIKQTGIVSFELMIDVDSNFSNPYIKAKPDANESQYQVSKPLQNEKTYYWKMRALSDGGLTADTSNWSPTWSFKTTSATGINETNLNSLSIYPNPSQGKINISVVSKENVTAQLELIDMIGKKVYTAQLDLSAGNNVKEVALENVYNGIYMVRLNIEGTVINRKLIIEK